MKKARKVNKYRSRFEETIAADLRKRKVTFEYETLKLPFIQPESKHIYKPDIILPNGIILELKGKFDNQSRKKMALVMEQYKDKLDIRMVFMRNQPLQKGAKNTYGDWCNSRGVKWCVAPIPEEWINE